MKSIPLRYLAEVGPSTPEFDRLADDELVAFHPLETVWSDSRADTSRLVLKAEVSSGYTRFMPGDVLCPKVTPTFQAGRSMIARAVGAGTTELHVLRPRSGTDPRWLCYCLCSKHFLEEGVTAFQGVAGLQRVPAEFVSSYRVTDYPPDEQRRIADFLDDRVSRIDRIIAARRDQIRLLGEQRQGIADELLATTSARTVRLGPFLRRIEQGWSPQCEALPAPADDWGVLKVSAVQPGWFIASENKRLPDDEVPKHEYEVHAGDLLVTRANTPERVGFFAVVPEDVRGRLILSDKIMRLAVDSSWNPRFVSLVGQSRRTRDTFTLAGTGTSGSMVNIRGDDIRDMRLPTLPLKSQAELVDAWEARVLRLQDQVAALSRSVHLLTEYKSSLITAAVTGDVDVTAACSNIPG